MEPRLIGALTIGQSPRPDLVDPLVERLPAGYQLLQTGALDGLDLDSLPHITSGTYPLTTRLQDGTLVMVEERYLVPRLQKSLNLLEAKGVVATILLCAGTFTQLRGTKPLFKPFVVARDTLRTLGIQRIGLITPIEEQETPVRQRWLSAGFRPSVWTSDLTRRDGRFVQHLQEQIETNKLEGIVLDYVGHPESHVRQLQETANIPVLDLGQLAIATLSGAL